MAADPACPCLGLYFIAFKKAIHFILAFIIAFVKAGLILILFMLVLPPFFMPRISGGGGGLPCGDMPLDGIPLGGIP